MWIYSQSLGTIRRDDGPVVGTGYAGNGRFKNDPDAQDRHDEGPLPRGDYTVEAPVDTVTHGPYVLRLVPDATNQMHERSGFLLHGDSIHDPGSASDGCIVQAKRVRMKVWESGDTRLRVIR